MNAEKRAAKHGLKLRLPAGESAKLVKQTGPDSFHIYFAGSIEDLSAVLDELDSDQAYIDEELGRVVRPHELGTEVNLPWLAVRADEVGASVGLQMSVEAAGEDLARLRVYDSAGLVLHEEVDKQNAIAATLTNILDGEIIL